MIREFAIEWQFEQKNNGKTKSFEKSIFLNIGLARSKIIH